MQQKGNSPRAIIAANGNRVCEWKGEPSDLEAILPFMFKPEPPIVVDDRGGWLKVALSRAISNIMEGLELSCAGLHPEIRHVPDEEEHVPKHDKDSLRAG